MKVDSFQNSESFENIRQNKSKNWSLKQLINPLFIIYQKIQLIMKGIDEEKWL